MREPEGMHSFASKAACKLVLPAEALQLAEAGVPPPPVGLHTLERKQGPMQNPSQWVQSKAGALRLSFHCTTCAKQAHDSTRLLALARTPCDGLVWQAEATMHDMRHDGTRWECSRCGHTTDTAAVERALRTKCPVPRFTQGGEEKAAAALWMRSVLGLVGLYRRAASTEDAPADPSEEPPADGDPRPAKRRRVSEDSQGAQASVAQGDRGFLVGYVSHRVVGASGCFFCLRCGETPRDNRRLSGLESSPCPRVLPAQDMPVRVLVATNVAGPEGVKPTGKSFTHLETDRIRQLAEQGARLAQAGVADWARLLQRGGECLM